MRDFESALAEEARFVETHLDTLLPKVEGAESRLLEAMRYAALGSGKRLRGFLVMQSGKLCGADRDALARAACAVECVHAYSLVHDDLPAMDDDDLRRGKPTVHKAFDEATAILAGDALLTFAFALLSAPQTSGDAVVRGELVSRLALASGHAGMVGGQAMDIGFEGQFPELEDVGRLQRMKTAALIQYSCEAGAIVGKSSPAERGALSKFGESLGLAFQIADDLLDAEGDAARMGKAARKDATAAKPTMVSVLGLERARAQAKTLSNQAVRHLDLFDEKADLLRRAAEFAIARRA
jgi:farnesyl diphosphate synthase